MYVSGIPITIYLCYVVESKLVFLFFHFSTFGWDYEFWKILNIILFFLVATLAILSKPLKLFLNNISIKTLANEIVEFSYIKFL